MNYFLRILFFTAAILLIIGFYIRPSNLGRGDLLIGLAVAIGFFVWMPIFLYHHWKDKDMKKYLLNKENIKKMQEHGQEHQKEKRKKKE